MGEPSGAAARPALRPGAPFVRCSPCRHAESVRGQAGGRSCPRRLLGRIPPPGTSGGRAHFGQGMAVFDLDRTLVPGASLLHYGRELAHRRLVSSMTLARYAFAQARFRRRGLSTRTSCESGTGCSPSSPDGRPSSLAAAAEAVGQRIADLVPSGARWLLDRHVQAGDFCAIVSASPHELVESVVAALGSHRAVGTRLEVIDGRCTGRLEGPFCHGPGKIACLERELGRWDLDSATAYADSAPTSRSSSAAGPPWP